MSELQSVLRVGLTPAALMKKMRGAARYLVSMSIRLAKRPAEKIIQIEAAIAARWASSAHRRLMFWQWNVHPLPEHFDHAIDLFYQWRETRNSMWVERGVFGGIALKGGSVLELSCGDGFNARNFYSLRSRDVVACDFDPSAISIAKKKNVV